MTLTSIVEIYDIASARSREIFRAEGRLEAPIFAPDGSWLLVNSEGRLWKLPLDTARLIAIDTGAALRCNNDHGFTKDGRILFGSHFEGKGAQIYAIAPAGGGIEKISSQPPSWWHGISPEGAVITYAGLRNSARHVQIFKSDLSGGGEIQLTDLPAHSDGPDFSADGRSIYWNCDHSGHAQIWVMDQTGANQRILFEDERVNWFPHPSPCGNFLLYLSYPPKTEGHPADLAVQLVLCRPDGKARRIIAQFIGGQGSLNVPPWHPSGESFAYIRYES